MTHIQLFIDTVRDYSKTLLEKFSAETKSPIDEASNQPLSIRLWGRLGDRHKPVFNAICTRFLTERPRNDGHADTRVSALLTFLNTLPNWQSSLYMFHVARHPDKKAQLDILEPMMNAITNEQREDIIALMVGDKPFLTSVAEELKQLWDTSMTPERKAAMQTVLAQKCNTIESVIATMLQGLSTKNLHHRIDAAREKIVPIAQTIEQTGIELRATTRKTKLPLVSDLIFGEEEFEHSVPQARC